MISSSEMEDILYSFYKQPLCEVYLRTLARFLAFRSFDMLVVIGHH